MTKNELIKALKGDGNSIFLNTSEIARVLHVSRESVGTLMCGCDYLPSGRTKKYLIEDIAQRIIERKGWG